MIADAEWGPQFEVGIPAVDDQHRRFVDYLNELKDAVRVRNVEGTTHVLEELLDYTITGFESEEELLRKSGYPYLKAHQRIHELFMKRISVFRSRSQKGEDVAAELVDLLRGWLASHIKGEDLDYVEYVRKAAGSA